ncbi:MAG: TetR family transcriptional regulator, partial [Clostridium sp.]|nr:TetR family transcriptional regulator [Clostridium sp.]
MAQIEALHPQDAGREEKRRTDRRVVRTKKAIRNAFARLVSRKPLGEITVKELSEEADINRKTFYNYYSDIFQVMDEV